MGYGGVGWVMVGEWVMGTARVVVGQIELFIKFYNSQLTSANESNSIKLICRLQRFTIGYTKEGVSNDN